MSFQREALRRKQAQAQQEGTSTYQMPTCVPSSSGAQGSHGQGCGRSETLLSRQPIPEDASCLSSAVELATARLQYADIDEVLWTGSKFWGTVLWPHFCLTWTMDSSE